MLKHKFKFRWNNFLGGGLLLIGANFFLYNSVIAIAASFGQVSWQQTEAAVTESFTTTSSGSKPQTSVRFKYVYVVNDREYSSHRHSLADTSGAKLEGVKRFDENDNITIYYDPEYPSMAVVEKRSAGFFVVAAGAMGIFLGMMAIGLMFTGDTLLLFGAEGISELIEHLTGSEQKALRAISAVEDQQDAAALAAALQGSLLRETVSLLKMHHKSGAVLRLYDKTGIDLQVATEVVERIAAREGIDLRITWDVIKRNLKAR